MPKGANPPFETPFCNQMNAESIRCEFAATSANEGGSDELWLRSPLHHAIRRVGCSMDALTTSKSCQRLTTGLFPTGHKSVQLPRTSSQREQVEVDFPLGKSSA